ncbi:MAG: trypsin-like peptidase domain-containing protein [Paracoccaceae bacterium]|nr:trypsin-like peptidase domain-containing protein [Paracoccaceae bacterium]
MMRRTRILPTAVTICLLATSALGEADRKSAHSVVKITCKTGENGSMKATGFVWPEKGYVVTALHAVAGCTDVTVTSEGARQKTRIQSMESVNLEADLALLRLENDMGLLPVPFAETGPALRDRHSIWGYPAYAEYMEDRGVDFSRGLSDELLTLGSAFSSRDLRSLFRTQDYPTRRTQILRVTSTTQPGHSGAPIFDAEGRVVAIHNGGLKGGWLGMNWSIPAHIYLPGLPGSEDPAPGEISEWAALQSAVSIDARDTVVITGKDRKPGGDAQSDQGWHYVGWVSLDAIEEHYELSGITGLDDSFDVIREVHNEQYAFESVGFDVWGFADSASTVAIPSNYGFDVDVDTNDIMFTSDDELFELEARASRSTSFKVAVDDETQRFFDGFNAYFEWDTTATHEGMERDAGLEYAFLSTHCIPGYDRKFRDPAQTDMTLAVNGSLFLGAALTSYDDAPCNARQKVTMELMRIGFQELTGIDGPGVYRDAMDLAAAPSQLTLVRRVPLSEVARDFVAYGDFAWKQDVFAIKALLGEDAFSQVTFDVYEDAVTNATVAVPTGMTLAWNDELEMLETFSKSAHSRLNISLVQAASFEDALGAEFKYFSSDIYDLANWSGLGSPEDCENSHVNADDLTAKCTMYLQGEKDGRFADIFFAMSVDQDVFLGTSLLILDEEKNLTPAQRAEHRLMRIAAEHLSDFALH